MNRFPWTPNHGSEQPCRIVTYDTETWPDEETTRPGIVAHKLRLGVASFWTRKRFTWTRQLRFKFQTQGEWWNWLYNRLRAREPLWVFAHNAAFDFTTVDGWHELNEGHILIRSPGRYYKDSKTSVVKQASERVGKLALDGRPFIVEGWHEGRKVKFVDSMNYLPASLETIAGWLQMTKPELPSESADDDDWWARCEADVDILDAFVMRLLSLWDGRKLGTWQMTMASLAYSSFRHTSPDNGIVSHGDDPDSAELVYPFWRDRRPIPLDAYDVTRIERRAYHGGRVATYFVGDVSPTWDRSHDRSLFEPVAGKPCINGPVTAFDMNGSYGYVMREYEYPVELMGTEIEPGLADVEAIAKEFPVIGDVELVTYHNTYPVRVGDRKLYARGRFITGLCGPELLLALERGDVVKCHNLCVYHAGRPFVNYVDYWDAVRQIAIAANDTLKAKLSKAMIVSLYGKLGQRKPSWEGVKQVYGMPRWGPFLYDFGDGCGLRKLRAVGGNCQREVERVSCRHTFTAAAAYVTSYLRCYMEDVIKSCPTNSVVYQDTDSLFCLPAATEAMTRSGLVHPTALGKFKQEGTYDYMTICGPKNYTIEGEHVIAGKSSHATHVKDRVWTQWEFERCSSIIAREPDGSVLAWQADVDASGTTPGVSVNPDGWTTPIAITQCRE